jgi:hypothetical protein
VTNSLAADGPLKLLTTGGRILLSRAIVFFFDILAMFFFLTSRLVSRCQLSVPFFLSKRETGVGILRDFIEQNWQNICWTKKNNPLRSRAALTLDRHDRDSCARLAIAAWGTVCGPTQPTELSRAIDSIVEDLDPASKRLRCG